MKFFILTALLFSISALADPSYRHKRSLFSSFLQSSSSLLSDVVDNATSAVQSAVGAVSAVTANVTGEVTTATKDAVDSAAAIASNISDTVATNTKDAIDSAANVATTITDSVDNVTDDVTNVTSSAVSTLASSLANLTSTVEGSVTTALANVTTQIFGSSCSSGLSTSSFALVVEALWSMITCFFGKAAAQLLNMLNSVISIVIIIISNGLELYTCTLRSTDFETCVVSTVQAFEKSIVEYFTTLVSQFASVFTVLSADASECLVATVLSSSVTSFISALQQAGCTIASLL